ncbi:PIG-L deacetylase family protein [Thalassoglobus polymorphus]|uniref:Mycothiol S-conjugate amidase n=1 Tax=Thalassoglobus polymorphus TaxID=2527994 RepID=A0A517QV06_9PLAN|nr:PIG-L family deacetylase [Thalassoglobus polymorphus]QDT35466.1 Mycothiol S-conjugate amidase [Thalassoglobus polymorphus]
MPKDLTPPRILAIHAHPDDIEILCAGTLAILKDKGCEIVIATMTAGDKGSAEMGQEEIARVRRAEARKAAEMLGAECMCLEFKDLSIEFNDDSRKRVTEAVRRARPDIVLTAPPVDYMNDHEMTSKLVRDACFAASVPNYPTEQWDPAPITKNIPHLYYVDPIEGVDWFGEPTPYDFIVDVTETFKLKIDMLACHESQRAWLRQQHGMDEYLESCKRWAKKRGEQINAEYGEGFRQHKGHPYPHDNLLLETLSR